MVLMNKERHIWANFLTITYGEGAEHVKTKFLTLQFKHMNTGYSGGTHSPKNGIRPLFF